MAHNCTQPGGDGKTAMVLTTGQQPSRQGDPLCHSAHGCWQNGPSKTTQENRESKNPPLLPHFAGPRADGELYIGASALLSTAGMLAS